MNKYWMNGIFTLCIGLLCYMSWHFFQTHLAQVDQSIAIRSITEGTTEVFKEAQSMKMVVLAVGTAHFVVFLVSSGLLWLRKN